MYWAFHTNPQETEQISKITYKYMDIYKKNYIFFWDQQDVAHSEADFSSAFFVLKFKDLDTQSEDEL